MIYPQDQPFACPADSFLYDWPSLAYEGGSLHEEPTTPYWQLNRIAPGQQLAGILQSCVILLQTQAGGFRGAKATSPVIALILEMD